MVTENLEAVMRNLRQVSSSVTVWIDQLCIDQSNSAEREIQVKIMGSIYRNAREVVIWLGKEADQSTSALDLAKRVYKVKTTRGEGTIASNLSFPEQLDLPQWGHPDWQSLAILLRRPWFERVWVIQEVAMATSATVMCGKATIPWASLVVVVEAIEFQTIRPSAATHSIHNSSAQRIRFINEFKQRRDKQLPHMDLFQFLILAKSCQATDPRDKIYSFFNLADFNVLPRYGTDEVAESVSLYRNFATRYIGDTLRAAAHDLTPEAQARRVMSIVYSAGRANQELQLPSWIPDWSIDFRMRPLWTGRYWSRAQAQDTSAGGPSLGKSLPRIHAGEVLQLSGIWVDSVRFAGSVQLRAEKDLDMKKLYTSAEEWFMESKYIDILRGDMHCRKEHEDEVFKQTVMANRGRGGELCSMDDIQRAFNGWKLLIETPWRKRTFTDSNDKNSSGARWLYFNATMAARGRVYILSEKGFVGLAPHGTRPGDSIWVLLGGSIPVLLRRVDGGFVLIGECYVHGIMDGEVLGHGEVVVEDIMLV